MLLDISKALRAPGAEFPFLHRDEIEPQEVFKEVITFSDVQLEGAFSMYETSLYLKGRLTCTVHAHCAACLKPVDLPLDIPFDEEFTRIEDRRYIPQKSEDGFEEDTLTFEGNNVDLGPLILTLVLLELPIRILCDENCSALPQENDETYACQKDPDQNPFSALQQLLEKEQQEE